MTWEQIELFERWLPIAGYEGYYEVSDWGRVRSVARTVEMKSRWGGICTREYPGMIINLNMNFWGRLSALLKKSDGGKRIYVHKLVAETFIGPRPPGKEIDHIDGDPTHNSVMNLRYVTKSENHKHAFKLGLRRQDGEYNAGARLTKSDVIEIRRLSIEGVRNRDIAKKFKIARNTVSQIISKKTWKHV